MKALHRWAKIFTGIVATSLLALSLANGPAFAQAPKVPAVRDQGEYDIAQAASKEADPQKKLDLLREWEQKYPDSDFKDFRSVEMAYADNQIVAKGLHLGSTPAQIDAAKYAAMDLLNNIDRYLAPEIKPTHLTDDQWKLVRQQMETQARAALKL